MDKPVLIASADPHFCVLIGHLLAAGGYPSSVIDPDDVDDRTWSQATAIIVEGNDEMNRILTFCRRVRRTSPMVPMMALIKTRHEGCYLPLMKAGVDECVLQPLGPDLILSCLANVISRRHPKPEKEETADMSSLLANEETRRLAGGATPVHLTPTEYRLLKRLLARPGHVVSRQQLIEAAWPAGRHVELRTVDVHIGKLRRALQAVTGRTIIRTVRASGFVAELADRHS